MTREEATEFIAQSVKSDVDMALVADAIKALEQEPTTKNCRTCRNFGTHHGICEICKDNKCWTEIEPTAKNDDVVALNFSDDIDTPNKYQTADGKWHEGRIPTTKNDLGVDCISREQAIKQCGFGMTSLLIADNLRKLPPVAPQPIKGHWKLVQRGKSIDICCFNCEAVRIKEYAYNYTIDQLEEDMKEYLKHDDMRYCPYCGSDNREVEE